MATPKLAERGRIHKVLEKYGACVELVPLDPNFNSISVGLYFKDGVGTVWSFSSIPGVDGRIEQIRDQLVALGGLEAVPNTHNQVQFACGDGHARPLKFLMMTAVEKSPDLRHPEGEISIKDMKTDLVLTASGEEIDGRYVYTLDADGEAKNKAVRIMAAGRGFVRYADMEAVTQTQVAFQCGARHDALMRLIYRYARNLSGSADMLDAMATRGQMTTSTLGFSQN